MSDKGNPQMLALHWITSKGQSICEEWGSARIQRSQGEYVHLVLHLSVSQLKQSFFQNLFQSTAERKQIPEQGG